MRHCLRVLPLLFSAVLLFALVPTRCFAQNDGSTSLADDAPITGLDSTDFTNNDTHTDVLDGTHANLAGSALSPADFAYSSSEVASSPNTTENFNALSSVDTPPISSGGRNATFTAGGEATTESSMTGRQNSLQAFGSMGTMTTAFAGGETRSAFTGLSTKLAKTAQGFSGQGVARPPAKTGIGPTQTLVQTSADEPQQGYIATDPVYTGQAETSLPSLQLGTDMPTPMAQATSAYLGDDSSSVPRYEYDDGQTPPTVSSIAPKAGTILGQSPDYLASSTGFPDSTKGEAALLPETANSLSKLSPPKNLEASPFAAVSDGTVFGVTTGLHPSLNNISKKPLQGSFRAYEKRAQEQRILHGMSISESAQIYRQDLRDYEENGGKPKRASTLTQGNSSAPPPPFQTTFHHEIR